MARRSSRPRSRPGSRATTTSTAPSRTASAIYQLTQRGGMRCSAAVAYLHPAMERPNLTVMPYMQRRTACCSRARARSAWRRAQLGEVKEFRAEREVIVCGGAYNSPQLLMLSGIGPAEHLTLREIEVAARPAAGRREPLDHPPSRRVCTTPEPGQPAARARAGGAGGVRGRPDRPVHLQPRRDRRLRPRGDGRPAPDIQFHVAARADRRRGHRPTRPSTASGCRRACCSRESRGSVRAAPPTTRAPSRSSATTTTRPSATCRRMIAGVRLLLEIARQPALRAVLRRAVHRARRRQPTSDLRAHIARTTYDALPPGRDVRDGQRGRRRAARQRRRGRCASSTPR